MDNQRITQLRTMPYEQYLQTPEWQAKRALVLERDADRCRACNSNENLEVHHRTYARCGCEDLNDLTTLCAECHEHFHKRMKQAEIMSRTYSAPSVPVAHNEYAWEEYLIGMLLSNPRLISYVRVIFTEDDFAGEATRALYQLIDHASRQSDTVSDETIVPDLMPTASKCRDAVAAEMERGEEVQVRKAIECATHIKRSGTLRENQELKHLLDVAYKEGNGEEVRRLLIETSKVNHRLRILDTVM